MHLHKNTLFDLDLGLCTCSLKLLSPTVKVEIHFQENWFLDLEVKIIKNVAQYPLHHMIYAPAKFEVAKSNRLGGDAFTRKTSFYLDTKLKVKQNITKCPLHHMTYAPAKFVGTMSNSLGEDTITRNVMDGGSEYDGHTKEIINITFFFYKKKLLKGA